MQEHCSVIDLLLLSWQAEGMPPSTGLRARMRAELTAEIKEEARRQMAVEGAPGLSLRAVTRSLGMASSAIYRYFPTRDDLLTALIVDAYDAIGAAAEKADADRPPDDFGGRWLAVGTAVRSWSLANPHQYALLYGSPVPGYRAPEDTVDPAARIPLALLGPLRDGWRAGIVRAGAAHAEVDGPRTATLNRQLDELARTIAPGLPPGVIGAAISAWIHLFGMISFELFGHLVGSVDPADEFFEYEITAMATSLGLPVG